MKQKKQSSLSRILSYAGRHKNLTLLGCILSALSAVLGLIPYVCVWMAVRIVLEDWPDLNGASGLAHWGWTAVWTAIGSIALYFAALMSTHIAAFRTARNIRYAAMAHSLQAINPGVFGNLLTITPDLQRICWLTSFPIWPELQSRLSQLS